MRAAPLCGALLAAATAAAAEPLDCRARLQRELLSGTGDASACFAPGARIAGEGGPSAATRPAAEALAAFAAQGPLLPEGELFEAWAGSTAFFYGMASPPPAERHFVLSVRLSSAGFREGRLYSSASPLPPPSGAPEGARAGDLERTVEAFNRRLGRGDVDGWLRSWTPDALFETPFGRYEGPELRDFFTAMARRYRRLRLEIEARHDGAPLPGVLAQATITGRCRGSGRAVKLPVVLLARFKDGRIDALHESIQNGEDCREDE